jgi:hypothetical protein
MQLSLPLHQSERERKKKREKEKERVRKRERERVTGALAPFSYLVFNKQKGTKMILKIYYYVTFSYKMRG